MALVDGGTFTNLDLSDAILKCKEIVEKEEDIIVDVILIFDSPEGIEEWDFDQAMEKNSFEYSTRKVDIADLYFWDYSDFVRIARGFPHVNIRYVITPTVTISTSFINISAT